MSQLQQQRTDFERVLARWDESLVAWQSGGSDRDRDSAILRFELTYEVAWKHLQSLARAQGLESAGPRQAFENAFRLGWIEDEVVWVDAIRARNAAVHAYREALAQELAASLPKLHAAFAALLKALPPV
jgi:nucleotidyltransferase substrate binding protein (TIGR01987 family)